MEFITFRYICIVDSCSLYETVVIKLNNYWEHLEIWFENKLYAFRIFIGNDHCGELSVADFPHWIWLITWAIIDICLRHIRHQHKCRQQDTASSDQISTAFPPKICWRLSTHLELRMRLTILCGNFNPASECCRPIMLIYQ